MELHYSKDINESALIDLYNSVGWTAYTIAPKTLSQAISNSSYVVTIWHENSLLALARCISDDATILYIQDILVRPTHQRQGYATTLVQDCLKRFEHVRQIVLLTDDETKQSEFYRKLGFINSKDFLDSNLNTFIRFKGHSETKA